MKSAEGRDVPNRANSARAIAASTDNTSVTAITRTALRNCANALGCGIAMDGDDNPSRAVDRAESDSPLTSQRLSPGRPDGSRCTGPGQSTRAPGLTGRRARARFGSIPTIVDGMTDGAAASNAKPPTTVGELMSSPVATAAPDETVAQVAARMREQKVGSVVVVDGPKPTGILTGRDLVRIAAAGADPSAALVSEWMTANPDTAEPDETVSDVFDDLAVKGYRHVPVVKDGALVGIVSMRDLMRLARILPVEQLAVEAPRGLEGAIVAETELGDVRGLEGFYHYRQYDAIELAEGRTFEDVWYLLHRGHLPSKAEREAFDEEIRPLREIPEQVKALLPDIAGLGERFVALDALTTAYSILATALDFRPWLDVDGAELRHQALQTCAAVPTLVMALYRLNHGMEPVDPDPDLPFVANYLSMLTGEPPQPDHARAVEQYLSSTIDHGFNASTFTARVIASTGADLGAAVLGAIGALSGPLHG